MKLKSSALIYMNELLNAADTIRRALTSATDEYEKWRMLVYKFNKFTMKFPLVALYMSKGYYNREAFKMFMEKLLRNKKKEMTINEFNELHANYAKFLYMKSNPHYDPNVFGVIISEAIKSLQLIFPDKSVADDSDKNTIDNIVDSLY